MIAVVSAGGQQISRGLAAQRTIRRWKHIGITRKCSTNCNWGPGLNSSVQNLEENDSVKMVEKSNQDYTCTSLGISLDRLKETNKIPWSGSCKSRQISSKSCHCG